MGPMDPSDPGTIDCAMPPGRGCGGCLDTLPLDTEPVHETDNQN